MIILNDNMEISILYLSLHMIYLLGSLNLTNSTSTYIGAYSNFYNFILGYKYIALFVLMLLESTSLPVPSEIVMPIAGILSRTGLFSFPIAFLAATFGSLIGVLIDYYIGYILGKDIIYKHLHFFHLNQEEVEKFDRWFNSNMALTVFISRLIPVIRTFMSFPAGFAKMDIKDFVFYSSLGIILWDFILMLFGYYLVSSSNINIDIIYILLFLILLYIIYKIVKKQITKDKQQNKLKMK